MKRSWAIDSVLILFWVLEVVHCKYSRENMKISLDNGAHKTPSPPFILWSRLSFLFSCGFLSLPNLLFLISFPFNRFTHTSLLSKKFGIEKNTFFQLPRRIFRTLAHTKMVFWQLRNIVPFGNKKNVVPIWCEAQFELKF